MPHPAIAITSGEPAGIGPELLGAIDAAGFPARLIVIGDRQFLQQRCADSGHPVEFVDHEPAAAPTPGRLEILHVPLAEAAPRRGRDPRESWLLREGKGRLRRERVGLGSCVGPLRPFERSWLRA